MLLSLIVFSLSFSLSGQTAGKRTWQWIQKEGMLNGTSYGSLLISKDAPSKRYEPVTLRLHQSQNFRISALYADRKPASRDTIVVSTRGLGTVKSVYEFKQISDIDGFLAGILTEYGLHKIKYTAGEAAGQDTITVRLRKNTGEPGYVEGLEVYYPVTIVESH